MDNKNLIENKYKWQLQRERVNHHSWTMIVFFIEGIVLMDLWVIKRNFMDSFVANFILNFSLVCFAFGIIFAFTTYGRRKKLKAIEQTLAAQQAQKSDNVTNKETKKAE